MRTGMTCKYGCNEKSQVTGIESELEFHCSDVLSLEGATKNPK